MKINIWANILGKEDIYLALISLKIYFIYLIWLSFWKTKLSVLSHFFDNYST